MRRTAQIRFLQEKFPQMGPITRELVKVLDGTSKVKMARLSYLITSNAEWNRISDESGPLHA